jgi:16S rRNA (cytidine1402-2'-O)-methyltransferase
VTKVHEEFVRGSASHALEHFAVTLPRGEITVVIGGADTSNVGEAPHDLAERAVALASKGHSTTEIAAMLAHETGLPRRQVYRLLLDARNCAKM